MNRQTINSRMDEARIVADQNDRYRREMLKDEKSIPGRTVTTPGVVAQGPDFVLAAMLAVASYDGFTEPNDPHGERDFGAFDIVGEKLFWKIDLFDAEYRYGTVERGNLACTMRVLTIMLRSEY